MAQFIIANHQDFDVFEEKNLIRNFCLGQKLYEYHFFVQTINRFKNQNLC